MTVQLKNAFGGWIKLCEFVMPTCKRILLPVFLSLSPWWQRIRWRRRNHGCRERQSVPGSRGGAYPEPHLTGGWARGSQGGGRAAASAESKKQDWKRGWEGWGTSREWPWQIWRHPPNAPSPPKKAQVEISFGWMLLISLTWKDSRITKSKFHLINPHSLTWDKWSPKNPYSILWTILERIIWGPVSFLCESWEVMQL